MIARPSVVFPGRAESRISLALASERVADRPRQPRAKRLSRESLGICGDPLRRRPEMLGSFDGCEHVVLGQLVEEDTGYVLLDGLEGPPATVGNNRLAGCLGLDGDQAGVLLGRDAASTAALHQLRAHPPPGPAEGGAAPAHQLTAPLVAGAAVRGEGRPGNPARWRQQGPPPAD